MSKFIRYLFGDKAHWGRLEGESVVELSAPPWSDFLKEGRRFLLDADLKLLPPCDPTKILCVGKNYSAHIRELHPDEDLPKEPLIFMKPPSTLLPPGGTILMPAQSERVDYEGELAVVIGKKLYLGSLSDVEKAIFGYTLANDITARDLQKKDGQWTRAKGFDTFCPVGPVLCTVLPQNSNLCTRINGEERQKATFSQMIFSVLQIASYISQVMTLLPGDLILTGTPEGVGPMKSGDIVEVEFAGIGILRNTVEARQER